MNAIEVRELQKHYGENHVLKGVSFAVEQGEIFALLGVNGAGKTTLLECIEGLNRYDGGSITVNGSCGVQLQSSTLPQNMKGIEAIRLFSKWNKTPVCKDAMQALGMEELYHKQYKDMSTGQKRRLHLAIAMLGDPDIYFLDEPTAGLDVEGQVALHEEIKKLNAQGKTIIMASHDMAEVEQLCHRVGILKDGQIAFLGTAEALTQQVGAVSHITVKTAAGEETVSSGNVGETLLGLLEGYREKQLAVYDVKIERATLEESFIQIARGCAQ